MVVKWSKIYAVGDKTIDRQHKEIIEYLGRLSAQVESGIGLGEVRETIDTLGRYIRDHFAYEEECMEKGKCASLDEHKKIHEEFKRVYGKFVEDFHNMYRQPNLSSRSLTQLLKDLVERLEGNYLQHMLKDKDFHGLSPNKKLKA